MLGRPPRRPRRQRWYWFVGVLLVTLLGVWFVANPSSNYTSAVGERGSSLDVAADEDGVLGLNRSASVDTGQTDRLFTLNNSLGEDASVTVTVDSGSTSKGDLVVGGTNEGDEVTFSLAAGNEQSVEFDTLCDSSLVGTTVNYTIDVATTGVNGTASRGAEIEGGCNSEEVIFVDKTEQNLSSIPVDEGTEKDHLSHKVAEIGPARSSLDSDGAKEIPYVYNNKIKIIGLNEGSSVVIDSSGNANNEPVGIGDYDGDGKDEVYYNRQTNLYAVRDGETPTEIVASSNFSSQLAAIAGVADFDGDGNMDIVFSNNNNGLGYVEGGTPTTIGYQNLGSDHAIGRPADFDGDGEVRVPVITSSSNVALVNSSGSATVLNTSYGLAALDSVAAHDIDGDGTLEVVFTDTSEELHYMNLDGSHAKVRNSAGNVVSANSNKGAA